MDPASGSQQNQPWSSWTPTNLKFLKEEYGQADPDIPVVVWMIDQQGRFTLSEGEGLYDLGLEPGEVVGQSIYELYSDVPQIIDSVKKALDGERVDATIQVEDTRWNCQFYPTRNARGRVTGASGVSYNISAHQDRIWQQEAVMELTSRLRASGSRDEMPGIVVEFVQDLLQASGAMILSRKKDNHAQFMDAARGEWNKLQGPILNQDDYGWLVGHTQKILSSNQAFIKDRLEDYHPVPAGPDAVAGIPLSEGDTPVAVLWLLREIPFTEREQQLLFMIGDIAGGAFQRAEDYEQTQRRLHRLSALHAIDQAITGTFDLNVTLNVILDQVVTQLDVHAADIFLYQSDEHRLDFGEGRGFLHTDSSHQSIQDRVGLLWQAARERALVNIPNLPKRTQTYVRRELIEEEGFITYFGIPLIAKGEIKGVLEIFHREELQVDNEWLNFFKTLANQAAIAIDNAALFEDLRKTNMKLDLAYHATLEGWVHALDLRDDETEGHTQRVTQRTLKLAKAMGINGETLVHIRRGALLHDIGKLGIPDEILKKPGPLSDEEWNHMKKHPIYAQEMLSEIEFLHPAMEIPYCHHEKWDGSGYPRGLKGERIPLSARVFAVIDVWDALTSDRPYRDSWPEEEAVQYILEHAGTHFDPDVVETWTTVFDIELPDEEQRVEDLFR